VERTALGRLGEADDLGKVIAALLSDDFGWVTGQNIEASGGFNQAIAHEAATGLQESQPGQIAS
jgi:NAD(P)-dependent dehydrogenase (short-subunit alcohol dehydrogenase family)